MLEKYIMTQLDENDSLVEKLNRKLLHLQMEEDSCRDMMKQLLENEDVGLEFFSPRNSEDNTREKIRMIKKQIANIQLEQTEISEKISKAKENEANYQEMLLEIRNNNKGIKEDEQPEQNTSSKAKDKSLSEKEKPDLFQMDDEKRKDEMKNILNRVEKCINLLYSDKSQCKHELINLKYYLKALISQK